MKKDMGDNRILPSKIEGMEKSNESCLYFKAREEGGRVAKKKNAASLEGHGGRNKGKRIRKEKKGRGTSVSMSWKLGNRHQLKKD